MSDSPAQQGGGLSAQALLAGGVMLVLAILVVPVPAAMLDALLAFNVGISILMLLVALGLERPLEFSVFPSLLLITTLLRLSLNVASTRLILLDGSKGPGAVGHVIETFGRFAVGGSLVIGAVVFLILLVVNFAVIAKGSGRVSEVAARFTLDALPGKQMSIDADLAAGLIDERDAKARRGALEQETEFFGAMDGASKFVRGDAVAGLIITGINILGGLVAGLARDRMPLVKALETYTVLTVGDGLVSQMPALLVSTAAGVLVTRASGADLGTQLQRQVFGSPGALRYASAVLGLMALLPGLPAIPFLGLAGGAWALSRKGRLAKAQAKPVEKAPTAERPVDMLHLDTLELQVGYALLPVIDLEKGGELPSRITALRRQLATDLGLVVPSLHLRDNLRLEANEYKVLLRGMPLGGGTAYLDRLMALDGAGGEPAIDGLPAKEPAFGLPARWIDPQQRGLAERQGLTVVDAASVLATHLSELMRRNAHELLGRQEAQELLGAVAKESPKLVEEAVPGAVSLGELVRVLRGLLREGVPVRDLRTILEAVADAAPRSKEVHYLIECARRRLHRVITSKVAQGQVVRALTLDRVSEETLRGALGQSEGEPVLAPEVESARKLLQALQAHAAKMTAEGAPVAVLAAADLRRPLFELASPFVTDLWVVCARELSPGTQVESVAVVQLGLPLASTRAA